MFAEARTPIRLRPWANPIVVVVLPSPSGVGVIAVTTISLPSGRSLRRPIAAGWILALYVPKRSSSSSRNPRSCATSTMGRSFAARAMSRLDFMWAIWRIAGLRGAALARVAGDDGMAGLLPARGANEMLEQDRIGHRADATGHGRDGSRDAQRRVEIDVAYHATAHDVDADIDDERAGMEHLAIDQAGRARGTDDDLGTGNLSREVTRPAVADGDRAVLAHEQQLHRLADDVAAPDDDGALALEAVAVELGDLHGGLGACRQEAFIAERHEAGVEGVDAVDVLGRHDRVGQGAQRDVPWQRLLDDDAGDFRVAVELLQTPAQLVRGRLTRQLQDAARYADGRARTQDLLDVDVRRGLATDDDRDKLRSEAVRPVERCDLAFDYGADPGREGPSIEDARRLVVAEHGHRRGGHSGSGSRNSPLPTISATIAALRSIPSSRPLTDSVVAAAYPSSPTIGKLISTFAAAPRAAATASRAATSR